MTDYENIKQLLARKLKKALGHFEFSLAKVRNLSTDVETLSEEELEIWESFSARFSRLSDIFLSRWVRVNVLAADPAFRGTFKDFLNHAEKQNVVSDATRWFAIRELRNKSAHDYDDEEIASFFSTLIIESDFIANEVKRALQ